MKDLDKRDKPTLVTSAFVEKDGKFLLVYDPKFKFWRVPGGRVEFEEKVEDCLVREMEEELGIKTKNPIWKAFLSSPSRYAVTSSLGWISSELFGKGCLDNW